MLLLRYKTVDSQVVQHTVPDNGFENLKVRGPGPPGSDAYGLSKMARTRFINRHHISNFPTLR